MAFGSDVTLSDLDLEAVWLRLYLSLRVVGATYFVVLMDANRGAERASKGFTGYKIHARPWSSRKRWISE